MIIFAAIGVVCVVYFLFKYRPNYPTDFSQVVTGAKLMEWMYSVGRVNNGTATTDDHYKSTAFRFYLAGICDSYQMYTWDTMTAEKYLDLIVSHLNKNPTRWNEPAQTLIFEALTPGFIKPTT